MHISFDDLRCRCGWSRLWTAPCKERLGQVMEMDSEESFALRVRIGDCEIELRGARADVLSVVENLSTIIANIEKAFESVRPKTVATLTVKAEPAKASSETAMQKYPHVSAAQTCEEAVLKLLETDWGKWRPRTMEELKEAMKANDLKFSGRVLATTLSELVQKGMVRRWNTNAGFVYILAEGRSSSGRGEIP